MKRTNIIFIIAGIMVLVSLGLNIIYPEGYWLWLTAFVGLNMLQAGFTKFCPAEKILKSLNIGTE